MTSKHAKLILLEIANNPSISDQFTEEEIEKLEEISSGKRIK